MKKSCEKLGLCRLGTREICTMALFVALTVLLSLYATLRIGNQIKVSMKFIPVFVAGALFGPVPAGLISFLGDLVNSLMFPVGPWLVQISLTEFASGFIYGLCFYRRTKMCPSYILRLVICVLCHFVLSVFVTSALLTQVGYFSSVAAAIAVRLPAAVAKAVLQSAVIAFGAAYLPFFEKIIRK